MIYLQGLNAYLNRSTKYCDEIQHEKKSELFSLTSN